MSILNEYGQPYAPQRYMHAAEYNRARGVVYPIKNADFDKLVSPLDNVRLRSLSSRLYSNVGVIKGAVDQKADYSVGDAFLPAYVGESDFADGKTIATFMRKAWYPNCTERGGVFDWHKLLELTSIALDRDGDIFWVKVKSNDGFPKLQIVPAHRVGNCGDYRTVSTGAYKGYKINDGVIQYYNGRPAAYRILTGENMTTFIDIDAANVIHIYDPDFCDQSRGVPAFAHALLDITACLAATEDERIRQQIVSRLHLTVFNDTGGPDLDDPSTIYGTGVDGGFVLNNPAPGIVYMQSGSGDKIEQVKHETPGEIWENFQDRMIRMSLTPVWSYQIWKGAGQGTDSRAEIVKCRRFVAQRQRLLKRAALNAFSWAYSCFQEANRVPLLDHPFAWTFSTPPRLSVDDGRESSMEVNEWRAGLRNTAEITEARGMTEEEFYTKRAHSVAMRKVIAARVAEEVSKESGYEIEIEEREMAMLTPNEMRETEPMDDKSNQTYKEDEILND
jgi:hypothetical protein